MVLDGRMLEQHGLVSWGMGVPFLPSWHVGVIVC